MMKIAPFMLLLVLCVSPVWAAVFDCPEIAQAALQTTDQLCADTGRNNACYGHDLLEAQPQPNVELFTFNQPGQKVDVAQIRSLRLFPMDITDQVWGVALMRLQASLPTSQPEDVTMLIFGSVEIENTVRPATSLSMIVATAQNINVRSNPFSNSAVIGTLPSGATVTALERLADNSWLRVQMPDDTNVTGWVSAPLLSGDIATLNVTQANSFYLQSMQSFYFKSSDDAMACQDIPTSGLLIQTPEGAGKVRLWINEVKFQIGSTVFLEAQPSGDMTIKTLEGEALVETMGVTQRVMAGTQAHVLLNENLEPVSPPSFPEPYEMDIVQTLPVDYLAEEITIQLPLTYKEIQEIIAAENPTDDTSPSDTSQNCPGNSCNTPGHDDNCPGNSCNAPGRDGSCPGNSCNAPGHNRTG
jgi:Bacterial SH3 domain